MLPKILHDFAISDHEPQFMGYAASCRLPWAYVLLRFACGA